MENIREVKRDATAAIEIRPANLSEWAAIWAFVEPVIRACEVSALPVEMSEEDARAYWFRAGNHVFVGKADGQTLGSYFLRANQQGGGMWRIAPTLQAKRRADAGWRRLGACTR